MNDRATEAADKAADERLYEAYRRERDIEGLSHAQILELGLFPKEDAERYCMRFSAAVSLYVNAMKNRSFYEAPDLALRYGNPYPAPMPERKNRED